MGGGLCPRDGLCPGGLCPGGSLSWGSRGSLSRGSLSRGLCHGDPLYRNERVVRILLECILVSNVCYCPPTKLLEGNVSVVSVH